VGKSGGYNSGLFKKGMVQSVEKPPVSKSTPETSQRQQSGQRGKDTRGTGELSLKHVWCYKCDKNGHLAKMFPSTETPKESHRVTTEESTDTNRKDATESKDNPVDSEKLWSRVVSTDSSDEGVLLSVHQ